MGVQVFELVFWSGLNSAGNGWNGDLLLFVK